MRFQTPQFIEIEDKIFGPLTLKQFIYLAGGAGLAFIWFRFLPLILSVWLIIPTISLAVALAFYKINNKPFIYILEAAFRYVLNKKLYIWRKELPAQNTREPIQKEPDVTAELMMPRLSESKLKDMAWSLGVQKNPAEEAGAVTGKGKE